MRWPAKLIGGRFDGDSGQIRHEKLPERLWAYTCPSGHNCQHGGIHWTRDKRQARKYRDAQPYVHTGFNGEHNDMPVAIYVHAPGGDPLDLTGSRETLHA